MRSVTDLGVIVETASRYRGLIQARVLYLFRVNKIIKSYLIV